MSLNEKVSPQLAVLIATVVLAAWTFYVVRSHVPSPAKTSTTRVKPRPAPVTPGANQAPPSDQAIYDRFHTLWYGNAEKTWKRNTWFGIPTRQNPMDVWVHQEILTELKPDFVLDIGTFHGGTALIWAMILEHVHPSGKVITVDIEDHTAAAKKWPLWEKRIQFLHGSSTDPKIVDQIRKQVAGKKVLAILDSNHSMKHVLDELKVYAPMIPVGSYVIVQDSNSGGNPVQHGFKGPMAALQAFLKGNDEFISDKERERLIFTFCPSGYLKRVKPAK